MLKPSEKQAFAKRLKQALKRSSKKVETGTELALQFSLRHSESISPQAAQKWLTGQTLPTLDKIEVLAEWLNVSVQWLRHGIAEQKPIASQGKKLPKKNVPPAQPTEDELNLLARIRTLPEHRRYLVNEIVEQFALDGEMWRD